MYQQFPYFGGVVIRFVFFKTGFLCVKVLIVLKLTL